MKKLLTTTAFALMLGLAVPSLAFAGPECKVGKACGDTCIAKDKVCHVKHHKECKKGKPCGDTCIAKDKVCHM